MTSKLAAALVAVALGGSSGAWAQTVEWVDADSYPKTSNKAPICVEITDTSIPSPKCPVIRWDGWTIRVYSGSEDIVYHSIVAYDDTGLYLPSETTFWENRLVASIDIDPSGHYALIEGQADIDTVIRFGDRTPRFSIIEGKLAEFLTFGECVGCDLKKVDLAGFDLTNANLNGADLSHANLENTSGADVTGAKLCGTALDFDSFDQGSSDC